MNSEAARNDGSDQHSDPNVPDDAIAANSGSVDESSAAGDIAETQGRSVGSVLGDIVWLLSQSRGHKHYALADLEWLVMPPLLLNQYRIFRVGERPVGVALWAYLSAEAEEKMMSSAITRLRPDEWSAGSTLDAKKGLVPGKEEGKLWIIELVCPFATAENELQAKCLNDLMVNVFKNAVVKFHRTDSDGKREVVSLKGAETNPA